MARRINSIVSANKWAQSDPDRINRVWTFRTQEQMDLWINEMQGQISDGMWENCGHTGWLWENLDAYQLGEKTELHIKYPWLKGKTFYPIKELLDCIGDRMLEDNGFETVKELRAAWREILAAIKDSKSFREQDNQIVEGFKALRNLEEAKAKEAATEMLEGVDRELEEMYETVQKPTTECKTTWKRRCISESRREIVNIRYNYMEGVFKVEYGVGYLSEITLTVKDVKELRMVLEELRECLGRVWKLKESMKEILR